MENKKVVILSFHFFGDVISKKLFSVVLCERAWWWVVKQGGEISVFLVLLSRFQDSIFYRHHHVFVFWKDGRIDGHMYLVRYKVTKYPE